MKKRKDVQFKDEAKTAFLTLISETINYAAVIATLIVTASLSIFMDMVNSTCNFLRAGFTTILSKRLQKNLKYRYNYSTAKLETISMIFCDTLLIIGTLFVFGFAIYQLCIPRQPNKDLLMGVILKSINVTAGIILSIIGYRVYRKTHTKVARSSFAATLGSLAFDAAIFLSVLLSFVFTNWEGVIYIEPIASILIAIAIIFKAVKRIFSYVKEAVDITISEKDQLKIDKILAKYFGHYKDFLCVKSHKVGSHIEIDFHITFNDDTTYKEIKETLHLFTSDLEKEFEKCRVSIIIKND